MRLLLDQNLSRGLLRALEPRYPGSSHVALVGLDRAPDADIWAFAATHGFAVVSKDSDFVELARRRGPPPKVIHLDVGNQGTAAIERLLLAAADDILAFDTGAAGLLVISVGGR